MPPSSAASSIPAHHAALLLLLLGLLLGYAAYPLLHAAPPPPAVIVTYRSDEEAQLLTKQHAALASAAAGGAGAAPPCAAAHPASSSGAEAAAAVRASFARAFAQEFAVSALDVGLTDAEHLAPLLAVRFLNWRAYAVTPEARPLVIDVGANIGQTSQALLEVYGRCSEAYHPSYTGGGGGCTQPAALVLSYEPNSVNYRAMLARGEGFNWSTTGWSAHHAALTSPALAAAGHAKFFVKGVTGDQHGSLDSSVSGGLTDFELVPVHTLDGHLEALGLGARRVALLKVDTEGFDFHVLRGAEGALREQRVDFVIFEYNSMWRQVPPVEVGGVEVAATLEAAVGAMLQLKYACFYLFPENLVPLYGFWWQPCVSSLALLQRVAGRTGPSHPFLASYLTHSYRSLAHHCTLTTLLRQGL